MQFLGKSDTVRRIKMTSLGLGSQLYKGMLKK